MTGSRWTPTSGVRDAIALVFRKFAEFGSGRQVHLWFRQEGIELPAVRHGPRGREVIWKPPVYNSIKKMLANPVYAGAYAWGRSIIRVELAGGHKRKAREYRKNPEDWPILIPDHHGGYITWHDYERNQRMIADNAGAMPSAPRAVRHGSGPPRRPAALRPLRPQAPGQLSGKVQRALQVPRERGSGRGTMCVVRRPAC